MKEGHWNRCLIAVAGALSQLVKRLTEVAESRKE